MENATNSSNHPADSSVRSDSATVLSQINDIESGILHQTDPSRQSIKLLLQLNQVKLTLLEGELKGTDTSNSGDVTSDDNDDEFHSTQIRSKASLHSKHRPKSERTGSLIGPNNERNRGPITRSRSGPMPGSIDNGGLPIQISIDSEDDDIVSHVSAYDYSWRANRSHRGDSSIRSCTVRKVPLIRTVQESDPTIKVTPDLRIVERTGPPPFSSTAWNTLTYILTYFVSDVCIPREGPSAKKAWREKVAIFALFLLVSACFTTVASVLPLVFCPETEGYYDAQEVFEDGNIRLFGKVYDVRNFSSHHVQSSRTLERYFGQDVSHLFPRLPPARLPQFCLNTLLGEAAFNRTNANGLRNITCVGISEEEELRYGDPCHKSIVGREQINSKLGSYEIGFLVVSQFDLQPTGLPDGTQFIKVDNNVYNVTRFVSQSRNPYSTNANESIKDTPYLSSQITNMIFAKVNEDATLLFHDIFSVEEKSVVNGCLDELFYYAQIDTRYQESCSRLAISQYALIGILSFLIVVQVVCSLFYIARRLHFVKDEDMQKGLLVMVPCYNESDKELRKTIDSVLNNDYPDEKRILVVVADGVITGAGETMSCPKVLASLLGFDFDPSDIAHPYNSLGAITTNFASIYSGIYTAPECPEKKLMYVVLVKQGCPQERLTPRAGNRGKRDSQILLFGILNRLQYGRKLTALDLKFMETLDSFGLHHRDIEYLMAIDADTRVSDTSLKFLVHKLEHDNSVLACCGETRVDNKVQSFVTMIQVFEYYSAHHLKKAFESVFGCVTCLPGCFTLYRLYTEESEPLLTSDVIVSNYARNDISSLHERNLYELGEDRMLTTLLLQHFYGMKLSFVPEAVCWTIVPSTFKILTSQRRRWINSTVHNMLELLKVQTMCGVCFFSMKMVVVFDLLSTALLPSGCVYLYYIIIEAAISSDEMSSLAILSFAYIGLMVVPFVMRAQWEYFLWFFFFLIGGIPVFYFYLPVYAFWHMDDLSWGKTRQVKHDTNDQNGERANARNSQDIEMGKDSATIHFTATDSSTSKEVADETCSSEQCLVSPLPAFTAMTTTTERAKRNKDGRRSTRTLTDVADDDQPVIQSRSVTSMKSETKPKSKMKKKKSKSSDGGKKEGKELTVVESSRTSLEETETKEGIVTVMDNSINVDPSSETTSLEKTEKTGNISLTEDRGSTSDEAEVSANQPHVEEPPKQKKKKKKTKKSSCEGKESKRTLDGTISTCTSSSSSSFNEAKTSPKKTKKRSKRIDGTGDVTTILPDGH